jgi:hypothetical protein
MLFPVKEDSKLSLLDSDTQILASFVMQGSGHITDRVENAMVNGRLGALQPSSSPGMLLRVESALAMALGGFCVVWWAVRQWVSPSSGTTSLACGPT